MEDLLMRTGIDAPLVDLVMALVGQPRWQSSSQQILSDRTTQFIDITDRLLQLVAHSRIHTGTVNVQTLHTTTGIVVNEHEPLLLADFEELLSELAPASRTYRHDDVRRRTVNLTARERVNGHAHCRALCLPTSVTLNVVGGRLQLGTWQRVFFVELDGPQERSITIVLNGTDLSLGQ
jgi:secondary thiamine-phosphate synthase enzyme